MRRVFVLTITAIMVTTAFAIAAAPPRATSVSIARLAEFVPVFHPINAQSNQYLLFYPLFSQLVKLDLTDGSLQRVVPDLAQKWTVNANATVFTFSLRKDVKWHDGNRLTADDVVFTATWAAQNQAAHIGLKPAFFSIKDAARAASACAAEKTIAKCGGTEPLAGVKKIDTFTVQFTLEEPNALFLRNLADAPSSIMPKHLLAGKTAEQINRGEFKTRPVGTGPYKFVRFRPGQFVELAANRDYFKGAPKIDRFFYKDITAETALAQLESAELDVGLSVGPDNLDRLSRVGHLNVQVVPSAGVAVLLLLVESAQQRANPTLAPKPGMKPGWDFTDKRVRQAIYYAIDRRGINNKLYGGRNKILWNPPGFVKYPGLNEYPFDPGKAKELLAQSRVDLSKPIRFIVADDPDSRRVTPIIKDQLEAVGFKIELRSMDLSTWEKTAFGDATIRDQWDMTYAFGGSEGLHPSRSSIYFLCEPEKLHDTGYYNCEMRKLFNEALTKANPADQDKIYERIARIFNEEMPEPYFWQVSGVHAINKRVGGGLRRIPMFERYVTMNAETWEIARR